MVTLPVGGPWRVVEPTTTFSSRQSQWRPYTGSWLLFYVRRGPRRSLTERSPSVRVLHCPTLSKFIRNLTLDSSNFVKIKYRVVLWRRWDIGGGTDVLRDKDLLLLS